MHPHLGYRILRLVGPFSIDPTTVGRQSRGVQQHPGDLGAWVGVAHSLLTLTPHVLVDAYRGLYSLDYHIMSPRSRYSLKLP
jgi:hypothetical protein